jgi:hypothetical protein
MEGAVHSIMIGHGDAVRAPRPYGRTGPWPGAIRAKLRSIWFDGLLPDTLNKLSELEVKPAG